MKVTWQIDPGDIAKLLEFYNQHEEDPFVKARVATNLRDDKPPVTKEHFWEVMISCLLTTQQRAGPNSPVTRFWSTIPFPLRLEVCVDRTELGPFVTKVLTDFGGLRRSTTIGKEAEANAGYLEKGGWEKTSALLEEVRLNPTTATERKAARFIDEHFKGFGPKHRETSCNGWG